MFLVMMLKEKRDLMPLLVKFGVAVALSFAGFLYSRLRTRKTKPYLPPPPSLRGSGLRCSLLLINLVLIIIIFYFFCILNFVIILIIQIFAVRLVLEEMIVVKMIFRP